MFEQLLEQAPKYLNTQTLTVIGVLVGLFVAFKAVVKVVGATKGFLSKFNLGLVTAGVLLLAGVSGLGYGIGDICNRPSTKSPADTALAGITDDKLLELAKGAKDTEIAKAVLDYAKNRDVATNQRVERREETKPIVIPTSLNPTPELAPPYAGLALPTVTSLMGAALASLVTAFVLFVRNV